MNKWFHQYMGKFLYVFLHLIIAVFFTRFFILEPGVVDGQSMEDTLYDGDRFLVNRVVYMIHAPERFDLVQMYDPATGETRVKRVIGLPGETVVIDGAAVRIRSSDGTETQLEEPYLKQPYVIGAQAEAVQEISVPEDMYVVLGDYRQKSEDSRQFGPVHRKFMNGKLFFY